MVKYILGKKGERRGKENLIRTLKVRALKKKRKFQGNPHSFSARYVFHPYS